MNDKCGSKEWLKAKAWFACQHCEDADETTVHRPYDLKLWNGKTICDDCWSHAFFDYDVPDRWDELDPFDPFACFEVPQ